MGQPHAAELGLKILRGIASYHLSKGVRTPEQVQLNHYLSHFCLERLLQMLLLEPLNADLIAVLSLCVSVSVGFLQHQRFGRVCSLWQMLYYPWF